jgi:hypothetical protein
MARFSDQQPWVDLAGLDSCMHEIVRIMEKAVLGIIGEQIGPKVFGESLDRQDDFITVGKAMYDFPRLANSFRGFISYGRGAISLRSQIFALREGVVPFKTLQNWNLVEFSSPVVIS